MLILANLLIAFAGVVHAVLMLAWWVLLARIVLSWVQPRPRQDLVRAVVRAIYGLTDPVLYRARRLLPFLVVGGLDLSPIAVFLALGFADRFLYSTLLQIGASLT